MPAIATLACSDARTHNDANVQTPPRIANSGRFTPRTRRFPGGT
jgi:hypothetical protein